jgi:hypothetical protein
MTSAAVAWAVSLVAMAAAAQAAVTGRTEAASGFTPALPGSVRLSGAMPVKVVRKDAQDLGCDDATVTCDVCPGFLTLCCPEGSSCVAGTGCVHPDFNTCDSAICSTLEFRGCKGECCGGECCDSDDVRVEEGLPSSGDGEATDEGTMDGEPEETGDGTDTGTAGDAGTSAPPVTPAAGSTAKAKADSKSSCVHAEWLVRTHPEAVGRLVHSSHIRAPVLCPQGSSLPCATAGHVVEAGDVALTYAQLCALTQCEARVAEVNAVYSHRWGATSHKVADGRSVRLTMFSDECDARLQIAAHRALEATRAVVTVLRSAAAAVSDEL